MKKILSNIIVLFFFIFNAFAQAQDISPKFFGQNAWMPDSIGSAYYNGKLHKNWGNIAFSGAGSVRFGGIGVDKNMPTNHQYIKMIDSIRNKGMEPMIEVPFDNGKYTAAQAANIVRFLNITKQKNIKYWIIANEPDLGYSYTTAAQIAAYIRPFASAMKAVDPNIIIIGPECASYNKAIYAGLTTPNGPDDITGKDANGRYYIDVISFHTYPFKGDQTRGDVMNNLMAANQFDEKLADLSQKINNSNTAHGRTGDAALKMAVTEANIDYANSGSDDLYGNDANSFIGGQFWSEMLGISMKRGVEFVNFWSAIEGGNNVQDIGYISNTTGKRKPSFYHFQMMAQNFKGSFLAATDNQPNVKAFASKSANQISVMILNEDQASNFAFTLNLDGTNAGSSMLKLSVSAGVNKPYTGTIDNQSTTVLVFDLAGNLIKKVEYKLHGNADQNLAPTETVYQTSSSGSGNGNGSGNGGTATGVDAAGKKVIPFHAFPNPMKDHFVVEATTEASTVSMEIYNTIGQLVSKKSFDVQDGLFHQKIAIDQNMAAGMYIVEVKMGEQTHTAKMILAK